MLDWAELVDGFNEINERELMSYLQHQRWFGAKGRDLAAVTLIDCVVLRDRPRLALALIETRFDGGASDIYQLLLGLVHADSLPAGTVIITSVTETRLYDASGDPTVAHLLTSAPRNGVSVSGSTGEVSFQSVVDLAGEGERIRLLGTEQSNTSIVFNDQALIKLYRRLEAGMNPELELLLFLTEHDFNNIPQLAAWYSYTGTSLRTTLGLSQQFKADAVDGWSLGLTEVPNSPANFLSRLDRLGEVIGEMHIVLASHSDDPDFAPEEPTSEMAAILGARIEEQIDLLADAIPDGRADDLRSLAHSLADLPASGRSIRTHGDLHLGQILWSEDDWLIIDFEGEPARSLVERRQKASPLRDVAGLLRSFAYLVTALEVEQQILVGPDWERTARQTFLEAYRERVAPSSLLPSDHEVQDRMIRLFELEKILYELDYEMNHRPDWISVPLAGINRLLRESMA